MHLDVTIEIQAIPTQCSRQRRRHAIVREYCYAPGAAMARKKIMHSFLQVCHCFANGKFWPSGKFNDARLISSQTKTSQIQAKNLFGT